MDFHKLEQLAKLIRRDILVMTTGAGSGHATSSLSAVELLTVLFFGSILTENDRFILSKGHASPLLFSTYHAGGLISDEELKTYRQLDSKLEGHPTPRFEFVDVATGSLGQGLSVGLGMVLGKKLKKQNGKVFVLLGDSEFSEGQNYEALQLAFHYRANNLIGILDVNRLGQRGETMVGWNLDEYQKRVASFGWETVIIDNAHELREVEAGLQKALLLSSHGNRPVMIIAQTTKGKGVSFLENKDGWHGKALSQEQLDEALEELGDVDLSIRGEIKQQSKQNSPKCEGKVTVNYKLNDQVSTREAYGDALTSLGADEDIVALDAEVSNSTFSNRFAEKYTERFLEMFIAEQNMVSAALGISKMGFIPFVSTFAAFLTRAFDQIRMSQYSNPNIKLVGSHAGVYTGQDGPSQMGLEDLTILRAVSDSNVFYPSDGVSTAKLTQIMAENEGLFYLRTTREKTPVIYDSKEEFKIGGSKVLRQSTVDKVVIFAAGITVHESLKAFDELGKQGINTAVVDLYSVKPLDEQTVRKLAEKVKNVVVVEDHYPAGALGEAVASALVGMDVKFKHLAVSKLPKSGKPEELLHFEEIDSEAIIKAVNELVS